MTPHDIALLIIVSCTGVWLVLMGVYVVLQARGKE